MSALTIGESTAPVQAGPKPKDLTGKVSVGHIPKVDPSQLKKVKPPVKVVKEKQPSKDYFTEPS